MKTTNNVIKKKPPFVVMANEESINETYVEDCEFCDGTKGIVIGREVVGVFSELSFSDQEAEELAIMIRNKLNSRFMNENN